MGRSSSQPTQAPTTAPNLGPIINTGPSSGIAVDSFPPPKPAPAPAPAPAPTPMVEPTGPNVFSQAQGYQTQAGDIYGQLGQFQAPTMQSVGRVGEEMQAGQIASTDLGQYTSPYMQQVIDPVTQQIERQRQLAQEQLEGQATRARAFGARRDLERDRLAEAAMRQTAQAVSPLYQQAYGQALGAAQFDIGQQRAADLANQQALEAAAAREQAARGANVESAFRAAGVQSGAAGGLTGLGAQTFGQGMAIQSQIAQQAAQQRAMEQQMIEAQRRQFAGATGAPLAGLGALSQVLGTTPYPTSSTTSQPFNPASLLFLM